MTTATSPRYIDTKDQAKLVRAALKKAFPGQKFSVTIDRYAGGSSIDVRWTDGPLTKDVDAVAWAYRGGSFDGMIDLGYTWTSWLAPDGSAGIAKSAGTTGSVPPIDNMDAVPAGAELVRFGGTYVFCHRDVSDVVAKRAAARDWIMGHCVTTGDGASARFGKWWVNDLAVSMVYLMRDGDDLATGFRRATNGGDD